MNTGDKSGDTVLPLIDMRHFPRDQYLRREDRALVSSRVLVAANDNGCDPVPPMRALERCFRKIIAVEVVMATTIACAIVLIGV